jgi:DNA methyltransferase 1-associated protein 1
LKKIISSRYYGLCEKLETLHADPSKAGSKPFVYDADHERRRKEQLKRLYNRTAEEVEEEEMLRNELKKIEARKKEREKKTQDLQKLIAQADSSSNKSPSLDKKSLKKKMLGGSSGGGNQQRSPIKDPSNIDTGGIKFPDFKV